MNEPAYESGYSPEWWDWHTPGTAKRIEFENAYVDSFVRQIDDFNHYREPGGKERLRLMLRSAGLK